MVVCIRGKLYSNWKDAEPYMSIYRSEQKQYIGDITFNDSLTTEVEAGRYRLIAGYGDPWSHRVLITRALRQLHNVIPLTLVNPMPTKKGWRLDEEENTLPYDDLYQLYIASDTDYTGRITVPLIWDHQAGQIINNESNQIMRLLNQCTCEDCTNAIDLYPENHDSDIETTIDFIYDKINNGVYKVGFAPTQNIFNKSTFSLFSALEELETRLANSRFLLGDRLTAADICLFVSLVRFDMVYHPYLRCNQKRLQDYPHLWLYTKDIYHYPGVKETVKPQIMMQTYYGLEYLNPTQVIPKPPTIDFGEGVETLVYELYSAPF